MWRLLRPDAAAVWRDPEVRRRLSWYYQVMTDRMPAKYLICKRVEVDYRGDEGLEELWRRHEEASRAFDELWAKVRGGEVRLEELKVPERSLLDLKAEIARRLLESCVFCERRCMVNRAAGQRGFCNLDATCRVSTWFHHYGEEAPLVPSGTIFFASCNFRCQFCQNWDISTDPYNGVEVTPKKLAAIASTLRREGCRNVNYVGGEPTPNLHVIIDSLRYMEVNVPILWNSNMYCSLEAMRLLREVVDIWLPDFKYYDDRCAERLSKVPRYFEVVSRNHLLAHECGDMIVRHLVMPNHLECCTKPILAWIAKNLPRALVNIMGQYRPEHVVAREPHRYPDIARRPTAEEMREAFEEARRLGIVFEQVS